MIQYTLIGLGIITGVLIFIAMRSENFLLRYFMLGFCLMVMLPSMFNYNNNILIYYNNSNPDAVTDPDVSILINSNSSVYETYNKAVIPVFGLIILIGFIYELYTGMLQKKNEMNEVKLWKW